VFYVIFKNAVTNIFSKICIWVVLLVLRNGMPTVAHAYNPIYSRGKNQKDLGSMSAQAKS
jgi:hypothetical protein